MARLVKCQWCKGENNPQDDMIKDKKGYFHKIKCYDEYLKDRDFKQKETLLLDIICKFIVEVYDLVQIPKQTVQRLQELRNGTVIQSGGKVKKYKQGVPYELIYDAYVLSRDSILWAIDNKGLDKDIKSINYGFAIMLGNLNEAYKRKKAKEQQEKLEQRVEKANTPEIPKEITYNKSKDDLDISDFL